MVLEAEANLDMAKTNLEFTTITSPVDGVVIDRKIDPGQTVASQFQTPVLFVVAPDLEKKIYVYASVDEADIGLIREAQARNQPVSFTVDAYPKDMFHGKIAQVRLNPSTVQNVVTYTVVVRVSQSRDQTAPRHDGQPVFPDREARRGADHPQRGVSLPSAAGAGQSARSADTGGRSPRRPGEPADRFRRRGTNRGRAAASPGNRGQRYVWITDGELLSAVEVVTGLSDKSAMELVSGQLSQGQEVVVGVQTPAAK